ncbi:MAG: response regulator, partial [Verrucomicrobiota bacterium]|nr:response regulator [Verrucomicrobiota bacterium]
GMTSLLLDTPLTDQQKEFVEIVRASGESLLTLINDILDFSKIESGRLELENEVFSVRDCVESTLDLFAHRAAQKGIDLLYEVGDGVPAEVRGDITRLRQILVNLVSNALKFTDKGEIELTVHAAGAPGDKGRELRFSVRDTGIGIAGDAQDKLFQSFSQVDASTTRKYGGTGLGLAICQRLCALMGGEITVESTPDQGSAFIFTIQAEPVDAQEISVPSLPAGLKTGPALILDDNPATRTRLKNFFAGAGVESIACATTAEAETSLGLSLSIAMLDAQMLTSNHADSLRQQLRKAELPLVFLLAAGQSSAASLILNEPSKRITASVTKPIKTFALLRALHTVFRSAKDSTGHASTETRLLAEQIPLDILLVEDNAVNQKVALRFLTRLGYQADAASNGREALSRLESHRYHLVLMDVQMPEMDGFETAREIRRRLPEDRQPKIIAVTANALEGDRELCLTAGMDDYITKPVKPDEIRSVIHRLFGPSETVKT